MRYLGIDFGTKKIGIAISDKTGFFAFPVGVLANNKQFIGRIKEIIKENDITAIILGKPMGYKGDPAKILIELEKFKGSLEKETGSQVIYENETLTTAQAGRGQGFTENIDASSAALILQTFLDKKNK